MKSIHSLKSIVTIGVASATISLAQTVFVPGDFATIQQAIDGSSAGSTIEVAAGTYNENLVITKSLCLLGAGNRESTINGDLLLPGITIQADNIEITGFEIRQVNFGIRGDRFE